jgi:uncharacterized phiE125 gp8 family phage protein
MRVKVTADASKLDQVSVQDVKVYGRITHDEEDVLLERLIADARRTIERKARISIVEATVVASYILPVSRANPDGLTREVNLPYGPARTITEVRRIVPTLADYVYTVVDDYNFDDVTQQVRFEADIVNAAAVGGRLQLTYTTGYDQEKAVGESLPLPPDLKQGIIDLTLHTFNEREEAVQMPAAVLRVIHEYWNSVA